MNGRICLRAVLTAAAGLLLLAGAPAHAAHVQCGDTLTTSTTLDGDVLCADDYQPYGLRIAADNVLLRMNGYALRAGLGGGGVGISSSSPDADGLQGVRIKRGSIEGFLAGIDLAPIDDSTIFKVNVTTNAFDSQELGDAGILLTGHRNRVEQSGVSLLAPFGDPGIRLAGNDVYAWGNVVAAGGDESSGGHSGVVAIGERPRLVYNRVACSPLGQLSVAGVSASGYTEYAVVNRNLTQDCTEGVVAQAAVAAGAGGGRVALNHTAGGNVGIRVQDGSATVNRNIAEEASDTGILLSLAGTFVRANAAHNNGSYGIYGPEGTVDGGGNVAGGNGDGTNPQCVNVSCSPPPPP